MFKITLVNEMEMNEMDKARNLLASVSVRSLRLIPPRVWLNFLKSFSSEPKETAFLRSIEYALENFNLNKIAFYFRN